MAIATVITKVDGRYYHPGQEIPDLGTLVGRDAEDGTRSYEGHYSDRLKLPKYEDLPTGSTAFLSDNGDFKLLKYYADTKTWEGDGEVT